MIQMIDRAEGGRSRKSSCSDDIIRNAELNVAEELRKQEREIERVDRALSYLEKMEVNELEQSPPLDRLCGFRGFEEVHDELDKYTALVQWALKSTKRYRSNCSEREYIAENFVEKTRDDGNIRVGPDSHNATATTSCQNLTNSQRSHLSIIPATTVHVSPRSGGAVRRRSFDNSLNVKPKELVDARQSVQNQRIHSASVPGSLVHLAQPVVTANKKSHPFLSQAGSESHSVHAAMQNVLGSLKRTLPGFHPIASTILNSDVVDVVFEFVAALRRYIDRVHLKMEILLEKYDSSVSETERSEISCEINHLYKIIRSATTKYEQLLDICKRPYYQTTNCPPLRQMKILHSIFSSNSL